MTTAITPTNGTTAAPQPHVSPDIRPLTPRGPEWPRLTRREVRQIILDIMG
ncbi:hypothetical protein [Azospirillum rugosum]|uniref:Uncharacterized protein n=1 Tax=Azospirillum rugosum TaxID=416170 RepID=A0ABS4SJZ6_9PROT|nr:hypothetical protein [Azospirillum rugosum]MBP2292549.1 hypothetical protein [Azospirillum rugosum]MDQ0526427.1 hypothetical protein [Azospirillum rugosum]